MGFLGSKKVDDKPLDYHANVVATLIGLQLQNSVLAENKSKIGSAICSILDLYVGTLPAPALLNHFAIGTGIEFIPSLEREFVRGALTQYSTELETLREAFMSYAKGTSASLELAQAIVLTLGYSADVKTMNQYEDSLVSLSLGVISDLAEKYQLGSKYGKVSQDAHDAYIQGVVATMFLGLLLVCEKRLRIA